MKIVIVGPGAVGSLLALLLSKVNAQVWLLDKNKARAQKIKEQGIKMEGVTGNKQAQVNITADPGDIKSADLVIICVKAYDTKSAALQIRSLVAEDTLVLTLQNGIGNIEILDEMVGPDKVIGGSTNLGVTLLDYGHIRYTALGETLIGRIDGRMPVLMRQIRETFNKAGLETKISRDIKGLLWSKLIINSGINALSAITHLNNGKLLDFEWTRKILRDAVTESVKLAKRKRIKLIYDDPLAKVEAVCEGTAENISSMLQDVKNRKRTEIDFINGVIVRQGQELGIQVPVNSLLLDLVKTIEASYDVAIY